MPNHEDSGEALPPELLRYISGGDPLGLLSPEERQATLVALSNMAMDRETHAMSAADDAETTRRLAASDPIIELLDSELAMTPPPGATEGAATNALVIARDPAGRMRATFVDKDSGQLV